MLGSGYPGTPLRNMQELLLLLERPQTRWPFTPMGENYGCQSTKGNNLGKSPVRKGHHHISRKPYDGPAIVMIHYNC